MSIVVTCPDCGEQYQTPAFAGDGAYTPEHRCSLDVLRYHQRRLSIDLDGIDPDAEATS